MNTTASIAQRIGAQHNQRVEERELSAYAQITQIIKDARGALDASNEGAMELAEFKQIMKQLRKELRDVKI